MKKRATETKRQRDAKKQLKLVVGMGALSVLSAATLRAEGFRDATTGAFDLGRSGGRIAQVDDATAVQNNPANLVDVTNVVAELDPSIIYINVDYKSQNGSQSASTMHPLKLLPNFFMSAPLFGDKLTFGFGVTVPYGLGNQWSTSASAFARPNGVLDTAANFGKLTTFNFNPSLAYKICDAVQIGAGLDVMYSSLEIRQFFFPPAPNLEIHGSGTGVGIGGNLGITWNLTDHQRLAMTYRSTMTVDYRGNADFENSGVPSNPTTSFDSQVKYPNIISAGCVASIFTDKIRLETDVEWLQFSEFKKQLVFNWSQLLPFWLDPFAEYFRSLAQHLHGRFRRRLEICRSLGGAGRLSIF